MKEIKYVSHLSRNIFIYFFVFLACFLLHHTTISVQTFFVGLIAYFVAYAPVYFLNDFADYKEDFKYKKANLYLLFQSKKVFWATTFLVLLIGIFFSFLVTPLSILFLLVLYILNLIYSYPPLRLRNRLYFREILIFSIYFIKFYLVLIYLNQSIITFPIIIIIMGCLMSAYAMTLYKRYLGKVVSDFIFGIPFLITWFWTILVYRQLFWMFFPLIPLLLFMFFRYKSKQIPLGIFQNVYFIYCIILFLFYLYS